MHCYTDHPRRTSELARFATTTPRSAVVACRVVGEVDMQSAPEMASVLTDSLSTPGAVLVLDLSQVSFFSFAGVHALLHACETRGPGSVLVMVTSPCVRRVLALFHEPTPGLIHAPTYQAALAAACEQRTAA